VGGKLRVLVITSEWPTPEHPEWATFIARQVEALRRSGVEVCVFSFRGAKNPFNYLRAWYAVQRLIWKNRFDLVHAHFGQSGLLAIFNTIPLVVTFHGSDIQGIMGDTGKYLLIGRLLRQISRLVACRADEAIVVSQHLASFLPSRSYHTLPMGINLEMFCPMPQTEARLALGLAIDTHYILFGGNPDIPVKRFELAQSATDRIRPQFPDISILVLKGIHPSRVPYYMNACDVLLLTSTHEGSPTVVKEALACNLPVVAVDVGDIRERIGNINGCVVCTDDKPETIAEGLSAVLMSRTRINGRNTVHDLGEEIIAQKLIALYYQVVPSA